MGTEQPGGLGPCGSRTLKTEGSRPVPRVLHDFEIVSFP